MNDDPSLVQEPWPLENSKQQAITPTSAGDRLKLNRRVWVALGSVLLLSGAAVGLLQLGDTGSDADRRPAVRILPAKTMPVAAVQSYSVAQTYTGEVKAARSSELGFERAGTLIWLGVDQGDWVTTGTAIAKLDTRNQEAQRQRLLAQKAQQLAVLQELENGPRVEAIAAAQAEVSQLEQDLELERLRRDRRQYLHREGAVSQEQLDEVSFNQAALLQRLAAAQSNLDELQAGTRPEQIAAQQAVIRQLEAEIADLEITIAKSTITAPFSGTIGERRLDEGTVIEAGQSVVRLVEAVRPEVEIGVPAMLATQLAPNSRQQVQIGSATYPATIAALKPEVNPSTRTRTVVLRLEETALRAIAPQQVARLQIHQTIQAQGFWLPTTALVRGERGLWSCYALARSAAAATTGATAYAVERRDVEVLHTESDRVLVRGTLQPGDTVITEGTHRIVPGQLVQPAE